MKKVILVLISFCALIAQTATLSLTSKIGSINQLSINDFDLSGKGNAPAFFGASIKISGATGESVKAVFMVEVLRDGSPLFTSTSKEVADIADDDQSWTSSDLGATINWPVSKDGNEKKQKLSFKNTNPAGLSKTTSSMPDGAYDVRLTVTLNGDATEATLHLGDIINDYGISLDAPADGEDITSALPAFRWSSNQPLDKIPGFTLYVYEVKGTEASSASMGRSPILKEEFAGVNTKFFNFPASNNKPIEKGKSYIWTIKSKINVLTGSGSSIKEEASSINKFTYPADPIQDVAKEETKKEAFTTLELTGLQDIMGSTYSSITEIKKTYRLKSASSKGSELAKAAANELIQSFIPHLNKGGKNYIYEGETKIGEFSKAFTEAEIYNNTDDLSEPFNMVSYLPRPTMMSEPDNMYTPGINPFELMSVEGTEAERLEHKKNSDNWEKEEKLRKDKFDLQHQERLDAYNKHVKEENDLYEKNKKNAEDQYQKELKKIQDMRDEYHKKVTEREKRKSDWENYNKNNADKAPIIELNFENTNGDTKKITIRQ